MLAFPCFLKTAEAHAFGQEFRKMLGHSGEGRRIADQHFADLRFLPMVPRCSTFRMESGANGTLQEVLPISTVTGPMVSAAFLAASVRGRTWTPSEMIKPFI